MKRADYNWKLPFAIEQRLGMESYGAQRAIFEDEHLLLVLHEPPVRASNEREHAVFLRTPEGAWLYHGQDKGEFVLDRVLDAYQKELGNAQTHYAAARNADELFEVLDRVIPLARAAANAADALQSAREKVRADRKLITARDRGVDLARGFELLLADARLALDHRLARNAEEQSQAAAEFGRAQHKLNIIAALTFPLFTVATVFGMNLKSGLEELPLVAFWAVLALGLMIGFFVKAWATPAPVSPAPQKPRGGTGKPKGLKR